jgi:hypothetical protein
LPEIRSQKGVRGVPPGKSLIPWPCSFSICPPFRAGRSKSSARISVKEF